MKITALIRAGVAATLSLLVVIFSFTVLGDTGNMYKDTGAFDTQRAYAHVETIGAQPHPRGSAAHAAVRDYILTETASYGYQPISMDYILEYDGTGYGGTAVLVPGTLVRNVAVIVAGKKSDAMVVMAHYDSVPMGPGAYDDTVAVASMLETLRVLKQDDTQPENTLIFLFTDGEEEGLYGAQMFADKAPVFNDEGKPYQDLMDTVKFVTNWEARGTGGKLIMFETTKGNRDTLAVFAAGNRIYTNSIANFVYNSMPNGTDYSAFSNHGVQGLNFANIGEGLNYHTQFDSIDRVDKGNIALVGQTMAKMLDVFGNRDLSALYGAEGNAVFYSYLNLFTVHYSVLTCIILAALSLVMLGVAVFFRVKKGVFKTDAKALGAYGLGFAAAFLAAFVLKLLLTLFGLGTLSSSTFDSLAASVGYVIAGITAFAAVEAWTGKRFGVQDKGAYARGGLLVLAALGAIVSFVMPELSVLFSAAGFFAAAALCVTALLPKTETWQLETVSFIAGFPIAASVLVLATSALGLSLAPFAALPVVLLLSLYLPYAYALTDILKAKYGAAAEAQPEEKARKLRKVCAVSAKRSGRLFSGAACVLSLVLVICGALSPLGLSSNTAGKASGRYVLFTDDALIYHTGIQKYIMHDEEAARYLLKKGLVSAAFDSEVGGYVLNMGNPPAFAEPQVSIDKKNGYFEIDITKAYPGTESMFMLTFRYENGGADITSVEVEDALGAWAFTRDGEDGYKSAMDKVGFVTFRSTSDSTVRVYTDADTLTFTYRECAYIDMSDVPAAAALKAQEPGVRTEVQVVKEFTA